MKPYDPTKPITPSNWPASLRLPPRRRSSIEPKQEKLVKTIETQLEKPYVMPPSFTFFD